jgi:hypothetical protein
MAMPSWFRKDVFDNWATPRSAPAPFVRCARCGQLDCYGVVVHAIDHGLHYRMVRVLFKSSRCGHLRDRWVSWTEIKNAR